MLKIVIALGSIALIIGIAVGYWYIRTTRVAAISTFEECGAAGYPILESYPAQCRTPDGRSFTQDIGNELEKIDIIRITSPRPGQVVQSPLVITGEARGIWFFEASFPIRLEDSTGNIVANTVAHAQGEWMTTEFVPFQATLDIPPAVHSKATLVLEKDNPSGLPENADALRVPVNIN